MDSVFVPTLYWFKSLAMIVVDPTSFGGMTVLNSNSTYYIVSKVSQVTELKIGPIITLAPVRRN